MENSPTKKFIDFRDNVLNVHSKTMCAAKWMDSTIWLYSGQTASCHHPPPHNISLSEISNDPSALHNTEQKKRARQQMQNDERPSECNYCWKMEDASPTNVSDRVFHSLSSNYQEISTFKNSNWQTHFNPKRLEIAFDRTCQFACSYCNPSFSTTWVNDIHKNGPYVGLNTDKRGHYESTHSGSDPYFNQDSNPYVEAFWQWWPQLKLSLKQLRITGGEPTLSKNFWILLDKIISDPELNFDLAVNSNLGSQPVLIEKLITYSHKINNLEIYTSNEAFGTQAEYIRDGLDFKVWKKNLINLKKNGKVKCIHIMMTINGLCLFSITQLLDMILELKEEFGKQAFAFSMNVLRWPTFQSPLVIPTELRNPAVEALQVWMKKNMNNTLLMDFEMNHCLRLIEYLNNTSQPTEEIFIRSNLELDLKNFMLQYDLRRNKNYKTTFPEPVVQWLNSIGLK